MLEEQCRMNLEVERWLCELEKTKDTKLQSLTQELNHSRKSKTELIAKRIAEQKKHEETVNILISQKSDLQMTQAEYERQMAAERERAQHEATRAAQAEAVAKRA